MESHKTLVVNAKAARGFTLMEILVVVGLLAIIGGFGMFLSMETYRATIFKDDRSILISALYKARSQSVNNMCFGAGCTDGVSHGVHIENGAYTVFQGTTYTVGDTNNEVIQGSPSVTVGGLTDVVFTKLSGETIAGTITLTNGDGHTSTITLNSEGMISWSF